MRPEIGSASDAESIRKEIAIHASRLGFSVCALALDLVHNRLEVYVSRNGKESTLWHTRFTDKNTFLSVALPWLQKISADIDMAT